MKKLAINGGVSFIKKPFDLRAKYLAEEYSSVKEVLDNRIISGFIANSSDKFYGGKKVRELESQFRQYFNVNHAVALNSATSALHAALVAIGIGPGDEVIVPSVSMSATASSVLMAGGIPVFVDIKPGRCPTCSCDSIDSKKRGCFNLNEEMIEEYITEHTKAIVVVHLFGKAANMDSISAIAKSHDLHVIEDCAQSPGALYKGKKVGTLGDIGVFSLTQSKTISAGEGGVAITNNDLFALRMQLIRNHGEAMIEDFPEADYTNLLGYNYRMTELEAAVALEQFKRLDSYNKIKIELANELTSLLSDIDGLCTPDTITHKENVLFLYPILYDSKKIGISRKKFVSAVQAEGVPLISSYTKPLIRLPLFQKYIQKGSTFPVADRLHDRELITTKICHHLDVTLDDMRNSVSAIRKVVISVDDIR